MLVYVLVAIVKKKLNLDALLDTLLQILSVSVFEKTQLQQAFAGISDISKQGDSCNQLNLFSFSRILAIHNISYSLRPN